MSHSVSFEGLKEPLTVAIAGLVGWKTKKLGFKKAAGFAAASLGVDAACSKIFSAEGRKDPVANSAKQITRFAVTVAGGTKIMGLYRTSAAFMINQGSLMTANVTILAADKAVNK
jgi:hypothetical protein